MSILKMLRAYVWEKRKSILLFLLYQFIFILICMLYQMDNVSKLLYGVYISLFISLCYGTWDFIKYKSHIEEIQGINLHIENILERLPRAQSQEEQQYQKIIDTIYSELQGLLFRSDLQETERTDYYTLWAHQIKTPIAAIRLLLQNGEKQNRSYEILEELFKIEQYVEMVLHYLRLESMSSDMLLKEYELKDIVNQAVKKHAVLFINSKLSFHMEDFHCTVVTDEKWLLFVIEQLISNAVKYTVQGRISIHMKNNLNQKVLIIEDTGIGIREEDLPRIFERGFTGYNGRFNKKSTGIGLYLCKQILDKLSHPITVISVVGKGTKVCIDFSEQKI